MGDPNAPPLDSESLLGLLDRHRVAYVLVGGLAAVAHGAMRATFDIGIVPRWKPDNLDALAGALRAADARLRVPDVAEPIKVPLDGSTFGRHEVSPWRTLHGDIDVITGDALVAPAASSAMPIPGTGTPDRVSVRATRSPRSTRPGCRWCPCSGSRSGGSSAC